MPKVQPNTLAFQLEFQADEALRRLFDAGLPDPIVFEKATCRRREDHSFAGMIESARNWYEAAPPELFFAELKCWRIVEIEVSSGDVDVYYLGENGNILIYWPEIPSVPLALSYERLAGRPEAEVIVENLCLLGR